MSNESKCDRCEAGVCSSHQPVEGKVFAVVKANPDGIRIPDIVAQLVGVSGVKGAVLRLIREGQVLVGMDDYKVRPNPNWTKYKEEWDKLDAEAKDDGCEDWHVNCMCGYRRS